MCGWIKVNTDEAAKGCPGHAGGGAILEIKVGLCWVVWLITMEYVMLFMQS